MTVREVLGGAPPHVSLKRAWKQLIQASRRMKRAGHSVRIQGRADIDRLLNQEAPSDWDATALKALLKGLVDSPSDDAQNDIVLSIQQQLSLLLHPVQVEDVHVTVSGGPVWLSDQHIDGWLGTQGRQIVCSPHKAAALCHHLDGLAIGGAHLSVTTGNEVPLPHVRREDRARSRPRGSTLWLPYSDDIGRISLTPRALATAHATRLMTHSGVIFDPFCGLGGNAVAAAQAGARVFAAELDPHRYTLARKNAEALHVSDRLSLVSGSGPDQIAKWSQKERQYALFLDPPWGGRDWDREQMNWDVLFGAYPALISAMKGATATLMKLPRTFDTESLRFLKGTWTFTLELGDESDHPADRVRFLCGLHRPSDEFKA